MLIFAIIAAAASLLFMLAWWFKKVPGSLVAAVACGSYAGYELLMHFRVLCAGECNIRVDLLLIWPLLVGLCVAVPIRMLIARARDRQGRPRHTG
jgi:hypothetical protein